MVKQVMIREFLQQSGALTSSSSFKTPEMRSWVLQYRDQYLRPARKGYPESRGSHHGVCEAQDGLIWGPRKINRKKKETVIIKRKKSLKIDFVASNSIEVFPKQKSFGKFSFFATYFIKDWGNFISGPRQKQTTFLYPPLTSSLTWLPGFNTKYYCFLNPPGSKHLCVFWLSVWPSLMQEPHWKSDRTACAPWMKV